jgi:arylsulfatase A-like enzyme
MPSFLVMMRFLAFSLSLAFVTLRAADRPPNIILFLTDDQGYADVGCFGARGFKTPNLDRLAAEGMKFTSFYVAQPVCTASRAALMTGCYSNRVGLFGALNHTSTIGISENEVLVPQFCQRRGYATACFGKWHLGHQPKFSPLRHGFDEFAGLPYPNDNGPDHPTIKGIPPLPWFEGEEITGYNPDQNLFTRKITDLGVNFIERHRNQPFFLYLAHIMPHVPIHASDTFRGKSGLGLYADVIGELDWSMGVILDTLKRLQLDENTLLLFTSDNGPFLSYGEHAGSAAPFRGGKLTTFEGGVRLPFIARWPGKIPAGRSSDAVITGMDLYPTIARLTGAPLPNYKIDGRDLWPLLSGTGQESPHEAFYYYGGEELQALRRGKWKLHFPHQYLEVAAEPGKGGMPSNFENLKPQPSTQSGLEGIASRHGYKVMDLPLSLFDLANDPGESKNVAPEHPDVVKQLSELAQRMRSDLGDKLTNVKATGARPPGSL